MDKSLPHRPNLDHLRRQAKSLLGALAAGDDAAIATFREFLPATKGMSAGQVRAAGLRLADAQSAIARKSGFGAWPQLARHVEQLRAMEGTWSFARLELDGAEVPASGLGSSRLLIDGDRFRTESPEGVYEGVFNIDVEAQPHHIDIDFVEGPEAGKRNLGIFRIVDDDELVLCLDMSGDARPAEFRTTPGSGCACETLWRTSGARPPSVTGGTPGAHPAAPKPTDSGPVNTAGFEYAPSATLGRLQGEWKAQRLVRDGQEMSSMVCSTGRRTASGNELKIHFGGQLIIHALVCIDDAVDPVRVDYLNLAGAAKGIVQHGIMAWRGEEACFCMGAPGQARPPDFECPPGSGRTLSQWKRR